MKFNGILWWNNVHRFIPFLSSLANMPSNHLATATKPSTTSPQFHTTLITIAIDLRFVKNIGVSQSYLHGVCYSVVTITSTKKNNHQKHFIGHKPFLTY